MTLGEKLSMYRRNSGMTQQELGEQLSISAQAISKWENDLSEPDISTLKKLSSVFNVSMVELLDIEEKEETPQPVMSEDEVNDITSKITDAVVGEIGTTQKTIGFCVDCGITVTEENVGQTTPKVRCSTCTEELIRIEKKREEAQRLAEEKRIEAQSYEEKKNQAILDYNRSRMRLKRNLSIITGLVVGILLLVLFIVNSDNIGVGIGVGLVFGYMSFAFTAQMFFDGFVRNLLLDWASKSVSFPGLIFSFDLDGFLWLIGMKILFAVLGFLAGVLFAILGFIISFVCAPVVYPFSLIRQNRAIKDGDLVEFDMD